MPKLAPVGYTSGGMTPSAQSKAPRRAHGVRPVALIRCTRRLVSESLGEIRPLVNIRSRTAESYRPVHNYNYPCRAPLRHALNQFVTHPTLNFQVIRDCHTQWVDLASHNSVAKRLTSARTARKRQPNISTAASPARKPASRPTSTHDQDHTDVGSVLTETPRDRFDSAESATHARTSLWCIRVSTEVSKGARTSNAVHGAFQARTTTGRQRSEWGGISRSWLTTHSTLTSLLAWGMRS